MARAESKPDRNEAATPLLPLYGESARHKPVTKVLPEGGVFWKGGRAPCLVVSGIVSVGVVKRLVSLAGGGTVPVRGQGYFCKRP